MDEEKWLKVEKLFEKFGYAHLFNEMRLGLYMQMNEDEWLDVFHIEHSLSHFKAGNMKVFTFKEFEGRLLPF